MTAYDALNEICEHFGIHRSKVHSWATHIISIVGADTYFREVAPLIAAVQSTYVRRGIDPAQVDDVDRAAELTGPEVEKFQQKMAIIRTLNVKTTKAR